MTEDIDFVVTWVDSSDPDWMAQYTKYRGTRHSEDDARYRNWDLFKFWFRAVEEYAPWVHRVFLVTSGHYPKWLNLNNPKIVLVKHEDYIPTKYLPTFNSRCIELNFGRIQGLSEHFVYFNDDMFLNAPITPDYYFRHGLPCDSPAENIMNATRYSPKDFFGISISVFCNVAVLNSHFNRKDVVKASILRWLGPHLSLKQNLYSIMMMHSELFQGFDLHHTEQPYLKQTFREIWDAESFFLDKSCTRFRQDVSLTPYFARYWQLASNNFSPVKLSACKDYSVTEQTIDRVIASIFNKRIKSLCINDSPDCSKEFYLQSSKRIYDAFSRKFPQKSSFEI